MSQKPKPEPLQFPLCLEITQSSQYPLKYRKPQLISHLLSKHTFKSVQQKSLQSPKRSKSCIESFLTIGHAQTNEKIIAENVKIPGSGSESERQSPESEDSRDSDGRALGRAQFAGPDEEAETGEQEYHLRLTTESRLRTTAFKAKAPDNGTLFEVTAHFFVAVAGGRANACVCAWYLLTFCRLTASLLFAQVHCTARCAEAFPS